MRVRYDEIRKEGKVKQNRKKEEEVNRCISVFTFKKTKSVVVFSPSSVK